MREFIIKLKKSQINSDGSSWMTFKGVKKELDRNDEIRFMAPSIVEGIAMIDLEEIENLETKDVSWYVVNPHDEKSS